MAPPRIFKPTSKKTKASQKWMQQRQTIPILPKFKRVNASSAEFKFKDTTKAQASTATAGAIFTDTLLAMVEGNTDSTRIGNRITVRSVMLRGTAMLPAATDSANTSQVVRIILYLDRQANGATATVADILASADYRSFNNLDNSDRFRTLAEETVDLVAQGAVPTGAALTFGKVRQSFFLKAKLNIDVKYKANGGDITDLASTNIGVFVIGESNFATVGYIARVRYTDQ